MASSSHVRGAVRRRQRGAKNPERDDRRMAHR